MTEHQFFELIHALYPPVQCVRLTRFQDIGDGGIMRIAVYPTDQALGTHAAMEVWTAEADMWSPEQWTVVAQQFVAALQEGPKILSQE